MRFWLVAESATLAYFLVSVDTAAAASTGFKIGKVFGYLLLPLCWSSSGSCGWCRRGKR